MNEKRLSVKGETREFFGIDESDFSFFFFTREFYWLLIKMKKKNGLCMENNRTNDLY